MAIRAYIKILFLLLTFLCGISPATGEVSSPFSTLLPTSISDSIKEKSQKKLEIYNVNLHNNSILFVKPIAAYTSMLTSYEHLIVDSSVQKFITDYILDSYYSDNSYNDEDTDYISFPDDRDSHTHNGYTYTPPTQIISIDFSDPIYKTPPTKKTRYIKRDTETTASYNQWETPNVEYSRIGDSIRPLYLGPKEKVGELEDPNTNRIIAIAMWLYYDFPKAIIKLFLKRPLYAFLLLTTSAMLLIVIIAGLRLMYGSR
jgi:hypothetical protein